MKVAAPPSPNQVTQARTVPANARPGGAYETNLNAVLADQCREVYTDTYKFIQTLSLLKIQGIIEVTVRTRTGELTVPITDLERSRTIGLELLEMLGEQMDKLEHEIVRYTNDSEENEPFDKEGTTPRAELFAFCLPMRPMVDAEFEALPPEARRAYDEQRAEGIGQPVKGGAEL